MTLFCHKQLKGKISFFVRFMDHSRTMDNEDGYFETKMKMVVNTHAQQPEESEIRGLRANEIMMAATLSLCSFFLFSNFYVTAPPHTHTRTNARTHTYTHFTSWKASLSPSLSAVVRREDELVLVSYRDAHAHTYIHLHADTYAYDILPQRMK